MSRIGKEIINIPKGIKIETTKNLIRIEGSKGILEKKLHPKIVLDVQNEKIAVSINGSGSKNKALWGLFRQLINNMIIGVHLGFEKILFINGVGYKVQAESQVLTFNLGFSHPVKYTLPEIIEYSISKSNNVLTLKCMDKELLGQTAANIRHLRPVEPYKLKGIRYSNEAVRKKVGKSTKK